MMMMAAEEKFLLIECEWKIGGCGGGDDDDDDDSEVFGLLD